MVKAEGAALRVTKQFWWQVILVALGLSSGSLLAQPAFQLPTANRAVFETGGEIRYFAPTVGNTWPSGTFGCVRTSGYQLHEGIDILHLQTDRRGEPIDPVMATADGTVAYVNRKSGLSNYGNYIVVRHSFPGLNLYSLYAHLSVIPPGMQVGTVVRAGDVIATMGRSTNTRSGIGKDRSHLHLEFDFQVHPRYADWHVRFRGSERNDHGNWNGHNLIGIDPWNLFLEQQRLGARFQLDRWIRGQTELLRVFVKSSSFPWIQANPALIRPNPRATKEGIAGYELALNYMGLPFECTPRAASEMKSLANGHVLYVNEVELQQHHCRKLVVKRGSRWELAPAGLELIQLLTF